MGKPDKSTREKAAAAKAEADAAARRAENRNRLVGIGAVVVVLALIFGGVWWSKKDSSGATDVSNAALPATVDRATFGVPYGSGPETVPQLQLWEDFQCPACAQTEAANGAGITGLADEGKIRLLWRPTTFLDENLNNDSSARATAAWGCAVDAGKAHEYHSTVFANQPPQEGTGFTDAQLLDFGKQAGITDAAYDKFSSCVSAKTYADWATGSYQKFQDEAVPGTPTGYLTLPGKDPKELTGRILSNKQALEQAITDYVNS